MQQKVSALKRTQTCNGANDPRRVDGAEHSLAKQIGQTVPGFKAKAADGKARASLSILFIDDQRLTRDCMTELIQELCPDMIVLGLRIADFQPVEPGSSVALIIFNLHRVSVGEAARLLRLETQLASPPVLFITNRDQRREIMEAVECGAMGLVRANVRVDLLVAAIRLVIAGGSYFPADTITSVMSQAPAMKNLP